MQVELYADSETFQLLGKLTATNWLLSSYKINKYLLKMISIRGSLTNLQFCM
jgi:hypothetical protein